MLSMGLGPRVRGNRVGKFEEQPPWDLSWGRPGLPLWPVAWSLWFCIRGHSGL